MVDVKMSPCCGKVGKTDADVLESPLGGYVHALIWIGGIAALVVWSNSLMFLLGDVKGHPAMLKMLALCSVFPIWVGGLIEGTVEILLFYILYRGMKVAPKPYGGLLLPLLILAVAMAILFFCLHVTHRGDEGGLDGALMFFALMSLPNMIISIVSGTLITENYTGRLNRIGRCLICVPLTRFLVFLTFILTGGWLPMQYVSTFLMTLATLFQLGVFRRMLRK